jgi:hypothetical protein
VPIRVASANSRVPKSSFLANINDLGAPKNAELARHPTLSLKWCLFYASSF